MRCYIKWNICKVGFPIPYIPHGLENRLCSDQALFWKLRCPHLHVDAAFSLWIGTIKRVIVISKKNAIPDRGFGEFYWKLFFHSSINKQKFIKIYSLTLFGAIPAIFLQNLSNCIFFTESKSELYKFVSIPCRWTLWTMHMQMRPSHCSEKTLLKSKPLFRCFTLY